MVDKNKAPCCSQYTHNNQQLEIEHCFNDGKTLRDLLQELVWEKYTAKDRVDCINQSGYDNNGNMIVVPSNKEGWQ